MAVLINGDGMAVAKREKGAGPGEDTPNTPDGARCALLLMETVGISTTSKLRAGPL
jgi:hypothetical protein